MVGPMRRFLMLMLFARLYPSIVQTAYEIAEMPGRGEVIMIMIAIKTI